MTRGAMPPLLMRPIHSLIDRVLRSWRFDASARDVDEELAAHIALHMADNIERGLSPDEARRDALLHLGGLQQTREQCLDAITLRWIARRIDR